MSNLQTFSIGMILEDSVNKKSYRIYHLDAHQVYAIELNGRFNNMNLIHIGYSQLQMLVSANRYLIHEETRKVFDVSQLSEARRKTYERNNLVIEMLSKEHGPDFLDFNHKRLKPVIKEITEKTGLQHRGVVLVLKKFLSSGCSPFSLLPETGTKSGKGCNYTDKTGRPGQFGIEGIVLDEEALEILEATRKHYLEGSERSYDSTYNWMIENYYLEYKESIENGVKTRVPVIKGPNERPTINQMKTYIRNNTTTLERQKKKMNAQEIRNNKRLLLSDNLHNVLGPGDLVEIDETEMDVSLVSKADPNTSIGRPIVHAMVDVFTRMIIAVSVSLDNNSYVGLTNCLMNLAEDKEEFCMRYGIKPEKSAWISNIFPNRLRADRGTEYRSKQCQQLCNELGITLELVPPRSGSLKGQVEQLFHQYHSVQDEIVEQNGLITEKYDSRHHEKAILTIDDIWMFVINQTLAHNMLSKDYPMSPDMIANNVIPTPCNLWKYGSEKYGSPRPIANVEQFAYSIRQAEKAKICRSGIVWKGLYYICEEDISLFDEMMALGRKKKDLACKIDPRNIGSLWYLRDNKLMKAHLNSSKTNNADWDGYSLSEYEEFRKKEKQMKHDVKEQDLTVKVSRKMALEAILDEAKSNPNRIEEFADTHNMRANRKEEKNLYNSQNTIDQRLLGEPVNINPTLSVKEPQLVETKEEHKLPQELLDKDELTDEDIFAAFNEALAWDD